MSGLINKVKEAVTGHKDTSTSAAGNSGTNEYDTSRTGHSGGLTGSEDYTSDSYNTSSGSGQGLTGSGNYGSDNYGSTDTTTRGPHSSNLENKLDPRVDSDGSRNTSGAYDSTGTGNTGYGTTSSGLGTTSSGLGSTGASAAAGPHSSNFANKADPRVDSDLDGRRGYESSNTSGGYGSGRTGHGASTNAGPHSSELANKADPRVDSDLDGRRAYDSSGTSGGYGSGTTGQGLTGGTTGSSGITSGEYGHHGRHGHVEDIVHGGPHHTETANKLDPQISGGGSTETVEGYGSGSGTHQGTTGPHKSGLLNKVDPRVGSDRDGSTTYGGNQTTAPHQGVNVGTTDPGVAFELLGGRKNADPDDDRAARNGPKLADDLRKYGNGM